MVSSKKEEVLWVFDFVGQEKADSFKWLFTSIHIVTKEKIVSLWRKSAILKESQEIIVLSMNVSTDLDWSLQLKQDWLVDENVSRLNAQSPNFLFSKLNLFSWLATNEKLDDWAWPQEIPKSNEDEEGARLTL